MPIRTALVACALMFGTLSAIAAADAADNYGGFGPSAGTETQEIGSNPNNAVPPPNSDQPLPWLQQQSQHQQDTYGGEGTQQGAVEEEDPNDDEDGH